MDRLATSGERAEHDREQSDEGEGGLPPGEHKVLIELAHPTHRIFTGQTVTFTVPGHVSHAH